MSAKLPSLLTLLSFAFTALAAIFILTGPGLTAIFFLLTIVAFAVWLWAGTPGEQQARGLVAPYLLITPLLLVLETLRFSSGWPALLGTNYAGLFSPHFALSDVNWFLFLACAPVSLVLLGGHFLSRNLPLGQFRPGGARSSPLLRVWLNLPPGQGAGRSSPLSHCFPLPVWLALASS